MKILYHELILKTVLKKLSWLGKLDSGSLKQKVAASIIAISSIHLLQKFYECRAYRK